MDRILAPAFMVTIGDWLRFLPATEGKEAKAYVSLAQDQWSKNDSGEWVQGDTIWYDGEFTGRLAVIVSEQFVKGDHLIVDGNTREVATERDGQTFVNTKLYVNGFGPDMTKERVTIDRTPAVPRGHQQETVREAGSERTRETGQQTDQEPAPAPEMTVQEPAAAQAAFNDLGARAGLPDACPTLEDKMILR